MQLDSSIYYYKKAVKSGRESNSNLYLSNALSNLSLVLSMVGKTDEAITSIEESIGIVNEYDLQIIRAHTYKSASSIYLKKSDYKKSRNVCLRSSKSN